MFQVSEVYWSRADGTAASGENEYASIQDNLPPGGVLSPGNDDMNPRHGEAILPLPPYPDVSQSCQAGIPPGYPGQPAKYNKNGVGMSPDSMGEPREYYVLDPESVQYQKNTNPRPNMMGGNRGLEGIVTER